MNSVILVFVATLVSISCVRIFPIDGTQIVLSKEFNVKPSPVALVEFTTEPTNSVLLTQTAQPFGEATYDVGTKSLEEVIVKSIIATTTEGPAELLSNSLPSSTAEAVGAIAPTKVVQNSVMETYDVPSQHLRPPKE